MLRLKESLLLEILNPSQSINKYSKSLLNLKTIIQLEKLENFPIPKEILIQIDNLMTKEDSFLSNIPLTIIEKHFYLKSNNFNGFIFIIYKDYELNIKVNELYFQLEKLYEEIFTISTILASFYNLEIKINNSTSKDVHI